ncbi:2-succinyl-5-enolpyruvyl-6-hydroxy-3-cyclohexene-1-carboxylic-acid synthase [Candidatus Uabimicrobium amorphum]|uniref:2-succinyl-5-enolpyruvyl-6-hydroxy-3-cyclohexene-1-carboxylate synthase n=1 Tax=Uabimicrobium amorphum TaxID=2596890 RepID=A0A5S9IQS4_UABAM|nr:2-succinyl-5-enolpyruvyl-6-hydroxy-3-cyclohexene-1-carboxylic-acid synthase [Candidatus Uabimicrobium amorphum]BBM85460.1 2-succinyl-5-enolpyruvyl-6-hydroxy-3-cyclohexene-1-carboxylate synthase [Candidatus Uabimicrobium amorphum]
MNLQHQNINAFWSSLIVEECLRNKITHFCISPGSRSSPLTCAIARATKAHKKIFYDERAAAFYAVGYARATGKPAVLVCTSGTAVANYLPAVVEAAVDHIPLIILSADRPPELLSTGANQTITQPNIYGHYCTWQTNLPCATEEIPATFVLTTIDQAIYQATNFRGVVHINCMFREPLAPSKGELSDQYIDICPRWVNSTKPYTFYESTIVQPQDFSYIVSEVERARRGIIVVGRLNNNEDMHSIEKFLMECGWPVFVDMCSNLRLKTHENFMRHFDSILLDKPKWKDYKADCIIHIGEQFISKRLLQFIDYCQPQTYIVVKRSSRRFDPQHIVTHHIQSDCSVFCRAMYEHTPWNIDENFKKSLQEKQQVIENVQQKYLETVPLLNELSVVMFITELLHCGNQGLFVGNSLAIRYFDMYAQGKENIFVSSNRGASGIDGNLATAVGMAQGLQGGITVVLGDISLLHDLNSLLLLKNSDFPIYLVVLNNQGGSIFEKLPIAEFVDVFEEYFITPHNLTFEKAAEMFSIDYFFPKTTQDFCQMYQSCLQQKKSCFIEIKTSRHYNTQIQEKLNQLIVTS